MKTMHLQEAHRRFYSDAFDVPAKSEVVHHFKMPFVSPMQVLVNVTSHRYDVSNAFYVELHSGSTCHFQGELAELSRALLDMRGRGYLLLADGFTLHVKNPFQNDARCPRLCFEFAESI